ncbi:MAG TPA: hypothetical protein VFA18_21145 [Gemmataceae bacterium]|nr:hypothetical protein [Gemmataceae bacterium]
MLPHRAFVMRLVIGTLMGAVIGVAFVALYFAADYRSHGHERFYWIDTRDSLLGAIEIATLVGALVGLWLAIRNR